MNNEKQLARIVLSRNTLSRYRELPGGTKDRPEWLLARIGEEIAILEGIAQEVPAKGETIANLIEKWREFADTQKARAH